MTSANLDANNTNSHLRLVGVQFGPFGIPRDVLGLRVRVRVRVGLGLGLVETDVVEV